MRYNWRFDPLLAAFGVLAGLVADTSSSAADPALRPGLYEVEVRISLPNVGEAAPPNLVTRCITLEDVRSGGAFFILSDNPLRQCPVLDYQTSPSAAGYRIECPGPNRGSAVAVFDIKETAYRGTIKMNMGGKNMIMSETQSGKRTGDCH
jgi:hypothetical protein